MVAFSLDWEPVGPVENATAPASVSAISDQRHPDATGLLGFIVVDDAHRANDPSNFDTPTH